MPKLSLYFRTSFYRFPEGRAVRVTARYGARGVRTAGFGFLICAGYFLGIVVKLTLKCLVTIIARLASRLIAAW